MYCLFVDLFICNCILKIIQLQNKTRTKHELGTIKHEVSME